MSDDDIRRAIRRGSESVSGRSLHAVMRSTAGDWVCVKVSPGCMFRSDDTARAMAHVAAEQPDLRHMPPLSWPGPEMEAA